MGTRNYRRAVLKGKQRFDLLFKKGKSVKCSNVRIVFFKVDTQTSQLAVCISRSIKRAVDRNRMKRITREALDPLVKELKHGYNLAIFPGKGFSEKNPGERTVLLEQALGKAGLIKTEPTTASHDNF